MNQAILEVALQEGYGSERAGWPLEYCGRIAVQMIGNFYDGVYRRYGSCNSGTWSQACSRIRRKK